MNLLLLFELNYMKIILSHTFSWSRKKQAKRVTLKKEEHLKTVLCNSLISFRDNLNFNPSDTT